MSKNQNALHSYLLEQLTEAFELAFFIFQPSEKRFVYLNPAVTQVTGFSAEDVLRNPAVLEEKVYEEDLDFVRSTFARLQKGKDQKQVEFRLRHSEKGLRWICVSCKVLEAEEQEYLVGYAEDFTEQKEYLYNLIKFNTKKNSTLEILSHDLASPFANIQGLTALLHKQGLQSEKSMSLLELIKQDAQRGSDMIRDFVNNEFLESSQVVLHKERLDIVHRLEVMIDNYKMGEGLIEKHFELVVKDRPIFMYVDEMKFMQVLNNLISNAIKFTPDDGRITVTVEDQQKNTFITVADNGIGIPAEMQPLLFDKFTKARRPGLRGEKSVGMGMSIIRNIVELHGGRIWFESTEGRGSVFYLEIPKE